MANHIVTTEEIDVPVTNRIGLIITLAVVSVIVLAGVLIAVSVSSNKSLREEVGGLKQAIASLNEVMEKNAQKQIAVVAPPATKAVESVIASAPATMAISTSPVAESYTVRLLTLYKKSQYSIAQRETAPAFEECAKEVGVTFCVAKVKGQRVTKAVLAVGANGLTQAQAKEIAVCFNNTMQIPDQENHAEWTLRAGFAETCEPVD